MQFTVHTGLSTLVFLCIFLSRFFYIFFIWPLWLNGRRTPIPKQNIFYDKIFDKNAILVKKNNRTMYFSSLSFVINGFYFALSWKIDNQKRTTNISNIAVRWLWLNSFIFNMINIYQFLWLCIAILPTMLS